MTEIILKRQCKVSIQVRVFMPEEIWRHAVIDVCADIMKKFLTSILVTQNSNAPNIAVNYKMWQS